MTKLERNERRLEDSGSQGNALEVFWAVWFQNIPFEVLPKSGISAQEQPSEYTCKEESVSRSVQIWQ